MANPAPPMYVPDPEIMRFHDIPRYSLTGGPAPGNQFSTNMDYIQGALAPAGGIIAFGAIFTVIYALVYAVGCCCPMCSCKKKLVKNENPTCGQKYIGLRLLFVLIALITGGLAIGVLGGTKQFADGFRDVVDGFKNMEDILDFNAYSMSGPANTLSLQSTMNNASSAAAALQNSYPAITQLSLVSTSTANAATAAGNIGSALANAADSLHKITSTIPVEAVANNSSYAAYAIMGLFLAVMLGFAITMIGNKCCSVLFRFVAPVFLLFMLLITILAAAFYAIGLLGSDVCAVPNTSITTLLNSVGMNANTPDGATAIYYTTCAGGNLAPMGAYAEMLNSKSMIDSLYTNITSPAFNAISNDHNYLVLVAAVHNAQNTMGDIIDNSDCDAVNPVWQKLLKGLCNGGIVTCIRLFAIFIAASVFIVIDAGIASEFCCRHRGSESSYEPAGETTSVEISTHAPKHGQAPNVVVHHH